MSDVARKNSLESHISVQIAATFKIENFKLNASKFIDFIKKFLQTHI